MTEDVPAYPSDPALGFNGFGLIIPDRDGGGGG